MAVRQLAQPRQKARRRDQVAAFTLDRLYHDGRHLLGGSGGLEQSLDEARASAVLGASLSFAADWATIRVRIRHVRHAGKERAETPALRRLACRERQRPERAAVKAAQKSDEPVPLGVVTCQLHRRLDAFRARVPEIDALREFTRRDCRQLGGQLGHQRVIKIRPRHVNQGCGLALDGAHHVRMAVPGGNDGDAGVEVEEGVAVHVFDEHPLSTPHHQGIISQIRRRHELVIQRQELFRLGAGKAGLDVGSLFHLIFFLLLPFTSSEGSRHLKER